MDPLRIKPNLAAIAEEVADKAVQVLKVSAVNSETDEVVAEAIKKFDDPKSNITGVEKLVKAIAIGSIVGTGTNDSIPDTVVRRDENGNFSVNEITVNKVIFSDNTFLETATGGGGPGPAPGTYVEKTGDTMTGSLTIKTGTNTDSILNLQDSTENTQHLFRADGLFKTKSLQADAIELLAGTGLNINNQKIFGLPDPADATDAVNLRYLNTKLAEKANTSHSHLTADITDFQASLDGKANVIHTHLTADITDLQISLDGKSDVGHKHLTSDITDFQTSLDGKANVVHTHEIADVTGLQTALNGKSDTNHTHTFTSITNKPTTIAGYGITDAHIIHRNDTVANPPASSGRLFIRQSPIEPTVLEHCMIWPSGEITVIMQSGEEI